MNTEPEKLPLTSESELPLRPPEPTPIPTHQLRQQIRFVKFTVPEGINKGKTKTYPLMFVQRLHVVASGDPDYIGDQKSVYDQPSPLQKPWLTVVVPNSPTGYKSWTPHRALWIDLPVDVEGVAENK